MTPLLGCSAFESREVSEIVRGWLNFIKNNRGYDKLKTNMLHLLELADGLPFSEEYMNEMKRFIDTLDDTKPDVRKVKKWLNR